MNKSVMDEAFERYESSSDKTKTVNGVLYYKAVYVGRDTLRIRDKNCVNIVLPYSMFKNGKVSLKIQNEAGAVFETGRPAFYSFRGQVPSWYLECGSFFVDINECSVDKLGEYFALCDETTE